MTLFDSKPYYPDCITIFLSAAIGFFSWGAPGPLWVQSSALVVPVLWAASESRWSAGLTLGAYTAAANRGLIDGVVTFAQMSVTQAIGLWLGIASVSFLLGVLCWHHRLRVRAFLIPVMLIAWALPPFGLIGWHPISAVGWLLPGWGWFGLLAGLCIPLLLALYRPRQSAMLALVPLLVVSALQGPSTKTASGWVGHNTDHPWGKPDERLSPAQVARRYQSIVSSVVQGDAPYHLYPENLTGGPEDPTWQQWQRAMAAAPPDRVAIVGAHILQQNDLYNALILFQGGHAGVLYRQRVPIPFFMWTPWNDTGHTPGNPLRGTVTIGGSRVAPFLCYEGLLVWPFIVSMWEQPDLMVFASSMWWAGTSLIRSEQQSVASWARLFDLPVVSAFNL